MNTEDIEQVYNSVYKATLAFAKAEREYILAGTIAGKNAQEREAMAREELPQQHEEIEKLELVRELVRERAKLTLELARIKESELKMLMRLEELKA